MNSIRNLDTAGVAASKRLRTSIRALLRLDETCRVLVTELACIEPGCAPVETVVAAFAPASPPVQIKVSKPLVAVTDDDLRSALETLSKHDSCGELCRHFK